MVDITSHGEDDHTESSWIACTVFVGLEYGMDMSVC